MPPPIEGMKHRPYGESYMLPAFVGCALAMAGDKGAKAEFKRDTGMNLDSLCSRGIARMIDEATGHDKAIIVGWFDWVAEKVWGVE